MRKIMIPALLILLISITGCSKEETMAEDPEEALIIEETIEELSVRFMTLFSQGTYEQIPSSFAFTEAMTEAGTAALYEQSWKSMIDRYGTFISYELTSATKASDFDIIPILVTCSQEKVVVNLVFDEVKRIAGFNFAAYTEPVGLSEKIQETDIEVTTGSYTMPGRLVMPVGDLPVPVVILASGSGPNDMDSTLGPNRPFRDIAVNLAEYGIGSIRFTKRTALYGKIMGDCVTIETEYIEDLVSACELAASLDRAGDIYLLGHSQGGNILPMAAAALPELAGYIIMAGPVSPIEELMVMQYEHLLGKDGELSTDDQQTIDFIKAGAKNIAEITEDSELGAQSLLNIPKEYWLSLAGYDPIATAQEFGDRMLILQGEKDYQVTMDEFEMWKAGLPAAQFISYPELNHLFMQSNDTYDNREYAEAQHVDNQVIHDIAEFMGAATLL